MLRRTSLCVAGVISLVASANAADLYSPAGGYKDAPGVPVATWTGFYAGVNGGYGWSASSSTVYAEALADLSGPHNPRGTQKIVTSPTENFDKTGGFGGGQLGYNYQWNQFVFGVETDIQGSKIDGSGSAFASVTQAFSRISSISASTYRESGLDYFGTVRGRLGYTFGQALVYATGGFAYGGVSGLASATLGIDTRATQTAYNYTVNPSADPDGLCRWRRAGIRVNALMVGQGRISVHRSWQFQWLCWLPYRYGESTRVLHHRAKLQYRARRLEL